MSLDADRLSHILQEHKRWLSDATIGARANLYGADLSGADLSGANLSWANLSRANLSGANLSRANLSRANLYGADLYGADLDIAFCRLDFGGWSVCVYGEYTTIGCQKHANTKWLKWGPNDEAIISMHSDASKWWAIHGKAIKAVIRCVVSKSKVS